MAGRYTRRQGVHAQGPVRFLRSHLSRTRDRQGFPAIVPFRCERHCGLERHSESPRRDQVRAGTEKPAAAAELQRSGDAGATPVRRRSEAPASRAHAHIIAKPRASTKSSDHDLSAPNYAGHTECAKRSLASARRPCVGRLPSRCFMPFQRFG